MCGVEATLKTLTPSVKEFYRIRSEFAQNSFSNRFCVSTVGPMFGPVVEMGSFFLTKRLMRCYKTNKQTRKGSGGGSQEGHSLAVSRIQVGPKAGGKRLSQVGLRSAMLQSRYSDGRSHRVVLNEDWFHIHTSNPSNPSCHESLLDGRRSEVR